MAIEITQRGITVSVCTPKYKAGDKLPAVRLKEHSPKVPSISLDKISGRIVIVGIPGAFTPTCSCQLPEYVKKLDKFLEKEIKGVYVVTVNDQFVVEAWKAHLGAEEKTKIHFLADDTGAFNEALGTQCDSTELLGNFRSQRYVIVSEDGIIESFEVEPDIDKTTVTAAENLLRTL